MTAGLVGEPSSWKASAAPAVLDVGSTLPDGGRRWQRAGELQSIFGEGD